MENLPVVITTGAKDRYVPLYLDLQGAFIFEYHEL